MAFRVDALSKTRLSPAFDSLFTSGVAYEICMNGLLKYIEVSGEGLGEARWYVDQLVIAGPRSGAVARHV